MADEEWAAIKAATRDKGPLVGEITDRTLRLTPYSPRTTLLEPTRPGASSSPPPTE
jgi:hypothetical protein